MPPPCRQPGPPACPRCGGRSAPWVMARLRGGGGGVEVRRCRTAGCGVGFTWPPPAGEPPPPSGGPEAGALGGAARVLARASLRPLRRAVPPPAVLVDLGAGSGWRALAAARTGYRVTAVEPDGPEAARALVRLDGRAAVARSLREVAEPADAVIAWHVVEHLVDLEGELWAVRGALRPGGLLVAAVPNAASLEAAALGGRWHGWDPARHRWHFTRESLARVLAAAGFAGARVRAAGGWGYAAALAFSLAPGWDPQLAPGRVAAGRALAVGLAPAAGLERALGRGPQLVAVARRPA